MLLLLLLLLLLVLASAQLDRLYPQVRLVLPQTFEQEPWTLPVPDLLQARCPFCYATNSVKALKEQRNSNTQSMVYFILQPKAELTHSDTIKILKSAQRDTNLRAGTLQRDRTF